MSLNGNFCSFDTLKHVFIFLLFLTIPLFAPTQTHSLVVVVKGVKNTRGKVGAALYTSKSEFMKKIWKAKSESSKLGEMRFVFEAVPEGSYAISVLHDYNDNGKMDTNSLGLPKEGYGFSNDVIGAFGPPDFEKASFRVPDKKELTITMKYF